jgi:hypothetical protein
MTALRRLSMVNWRRFWTTVAVLRRLPGAGSGQEILSLAAFSSATLEVTCLTAQLIVISERIRA